MKQLLLSLFAVCLFGCITQKKCNERFPPAQVTKDSVVYREVIRDTTIFIAGEEVHDSVTIPCPEANYHSSIKKGRITQTLDIKKGKVKFDCKEDSLQKEIELREQVISDFKSKVEVRQVVTNELTWFQETMFYGGLCFSTLIILLVIYGIYKFYRKYFLHL